MKAVTVFRGSPRKNGNTNALTDAVIKRLRESDCTVREFDLYDMTIKPCIACRQCQYDWNEPACAREDDMRQIFDAVMDSDLIICATPVYSWYCTPPVKAMLDRLVYAMNKYYGEEKGPSLWEGKSLALIATCGYPVEKGADLLDEGLRRFCAHSRLKYEGMLCERHMGYGTVFMDDGKQNAAELFADRLCGNDRICPCCGRHRFAEKDAYEICPVCGWEDDPLQRREPDFEGGANSMCLNEAIRKYHEREQSRT